MYKKVDTALNFNEKEKEILTFWRENKVFEKTNENNDNKPVFSFYDGPPTANGKPHIGHILTRVMKDIIPRYKLMKGYQVLRKAGWDTHGLPVELEIEKELKLDGKQDIEKYGIEPFIKKSKESVWKYKGEWERMTDRVGYWVDMENPYITYDDNYIESVWWSLKKIFDMGYIYKGHKIVPYCPRCGTALSSHEVAQGYKDVKEKSIFVKFKLENQVNTYFIAWTTTPWTLPSNVALCLNPKEDYVKVKSGDEYFILAKNLVANLFEDYEIVETKKGKDYEYTKYVPLFDFEQPKEKAHFAICDNFVTLTDGSGIVHIAPAFGEDDANAAKKYKLPFIQLVNERGRFTENTGELAGMFVKDADKVIIKLLEDRGLIFKEQMYEHSYPYCWRCDTPLLYYARSSYFIKMTAVKDKLLKNNNSVNWMPESIKAGRMGNFLENVIDWGLSRERYWGTPLPIWVCDKCGKMHAIGSKKELKELCGITEDIELHRPYIDKPTFSCECGGTYRRTPEVIDCWYDSGSMPFAQFHYPFENKDLFEKNFPADFISEAIDQTRGWFYTLLSISTLIFGKSSFKNCIVLGHVNDKDGFKMSKHKGNVVDPWTVLDKQGADAIRWYFYTSSNPWLPTRFYSEAVDEAQRKFMGTLWNTYAFFTLYAEIDQYDPSKYSLDKCKLTLLDKWIISQLNSLIKFTDKALNEYNITESARKIQDFVDDLSNWYLRRSRERFWGKDMTDDKAAAYTTLYTVLVTLSKLIAPYVPFISENIYQNLVRNFIINAPISVHLCKFPECNDKLIDNELEKKMRDVLEVVTLGRACRNFANIKNRQPLSVMYISSERNINLSDEYLEIAKNELNVKEFQNRKSLQEYVGYEIKPQLKTLGKKYGALINDIREFLSSCNSNEVVAVVKQGVYKTVIKGHDVEFFEEDLLVAVKNKEGFAGTSDKGTTVVLDLKLTPKLIDEGIERELVSKIQTMRKEAGFEVIDHINIKYIAGKNAEAVLEKNKENIAKDVLAKSIEKGDGGEYSKDWDINGEKVSLHIERVNKK